MNSRFMLAVLALSITPVMAAEPDALAISANIQAQHLPFGTILDPFYASSTSDQITGYTRCGDSAIWTGHYLAAEAFRYKVTRSPEALRNARDAFNGIKNLVDITTTNLLSRCVVPLTSPFADGIRSEEAANGVYTNNIANVFWIGNTSRDQYCGVVFGLNTAYDLIDDAALQTQISELLTRMVVYLLDHDWTLQMPDGSTGTTFALRPDQILTILQVAAHVNPTRFASTYADQRSRLSGAVLLPVSFDALSNNSYFKYNLIYINFYNLVRLETSPEKATFQRAYNIARAATASHQNPFFNMIDRALNGANATRDSQTLEYLYLWLKRPRRDFAVDRRNTVQVCGDQSCQPIPVDLRVPTDFLWQRSPFQLSGGGSGTIGNAGVDYILPYWMARYYDVLQDFTIQFAATSSTQIAAESLVSLFGTNLANDTAQAVSTTLPTTLAGVKVNVKDAAGIVRAASLLFVSPMQINLLVPSGTAEGTATITIVQSTGATLNASVAVQSVAPALFSMSGDGRGVAAATAIRMQVANPQLQSPVSVFACSAAGCVATPIDLGVDTPVYLTLYGTGLRNRTSLAKVTVTIKGLTVPVLYAGAQPSFPGLDQVNIQLPLNLRGSKESNVVVMVDGERSNPVLININ